MVLHKAPIPVGKRVRQGKGEDALAKEAKKQDREGGSPTKFDAGAEKGLKGKALTVVNPMNTLNKVTGGAKSAEISPLYFPGAKSSALRAHAGVKILVYRVESPEDISDPINIMFKLDLAGKTLRTSNPAAASQKYSRKYYPLKALDVELWENDGKFGISMIERQTSCMCFYSPVERDYIFSTEEDRRFFVTLIHSVDDEVLPAAALEAVKQSATPSTESDNIRLFVSTWNQGDTEVSKNLAGDWLPNDGSVDLFVIGTQESKLGKDSTGLVSNAANAWFKTLQDAVGDDYVAVATRNMFQNFLWVATKKEHANKFTQVETYQAEQGIGKVWGNKGGTAVALRFNGYKMAFVNTHLAAHAEKWEKRNEDIQEIVANVHFGNYAQVEFVNQYTTFWLGDLNYRVEMDREEATACVEAGDLATLLAKEQLAQQMEAGILDGFIEGKITFRPTYKFDPKPPVFIGTEPRKFSAHKDRTPSWTDRVLMRPMPGHSITQVGYDSAFKVQSSDHDPVFATYDFDAPAIPQGGNYRRFLLVLSGLTVSDLTAPGPNVQITINFPFLDDIKKGIKFKHTIAVNPVPNKPGSFKNGGTFKLGPFVTTAEFFRRRHVTLRVKDKNERHGTTSISLKDAVESDDPQAFDSPLTRRTYRRGKISGTVIVKVAGGTETGVEMGHDSEEEEGADADVADADMETDEEDDAAQPGETKNPLDADEEGDEPEPENEEEKE